MLQQCCIWIKFISLSEISNGLKPEKKSNFDIYGSMTAMLCAIHCATFPLLTSIGILGIGNYHNHVVDWTLLVLGLFFAMNSILSDFIKYHRNILPLFFGILGFVLLSIGISTHHDSFPYLNIIGGLTIFMAHIINIRYKTAYCSC